MKIKHVLHNLKNQMKNEFALNNGKQFSRFNNNPYYNLSKREKEKTKQKFYIINGITPQIPLHNNFNANKENRNENEKTEDKLSKKKKKKNTKFEKIVRENSYLKKWDNNKLLFLFTLFILWEILPKHNDDDSNDKIDSSYISNLYISNLYISNILRKLSIQIVNCCGIMGYIGNRDASKILVDGIEILQNRGYDSCGIATIGKDNVLKTTKYASTSAEDAIEKLKKNSEVNHKHDTIGIAHTRWATHGSRNDMNAHPHSDYAERISIVHNGIIENYKELKSFLLKKNISFKSNTDTEVIANLIGYYLDEKETFENATLCAIKELEGTWGLCIIHKDHPYDMILAANGSPLHIGFKDDEIFVASEYSALSAYTNEYISLKNGEILFINKDKIDDLKILKKAKDIPETVSQKSPDPFPHWTIKEIHEQPTSVAKALNNGGRFSLLNHSVKLGGLDSKKDELIDIENMVISSCGTSYYASLYGKNIMNYLNCFNTVQVIDPSDFHISVVPKEKEGVIFVSQSGETRDVIKACKLANDLNLKKMSVVNVVGSTIANMTGCGVYLNAGREVGVASTKCFTSQVVVLTLIALWFYQNKEKCSSNNKVSSLIDSLNRLPLYTGMTIKSCENICKMLSFKLTNSKSIFILGNGMSYPIALEGALKMKELCYVHAEGFYGSSLKHGPYALLGGEQQIPVIMLVFNDNTKNVMINTGEQIKSRGAHVICITDDEALVKHFADDIILIPNNGLFTPLLAVLPLQLLSYYISVNKGINPDKPRCIAKTVTVS